MSQSKEEKQRWAKSLAAIDNALDSEDEQVAVLGALAWCLMDTADSVELISQQRAAAGMTPDDAGSKKSKARKGVKPAEPEEEEEPDEAEE